MRVALSVAIGIAITVASGYAEYVTDADWVGWVFFFPSALLGSLLPHPNIGTAEHPVYEGTPLDIVAGWFVGLPLSVLFNIGIVYLVIRTFSRRRP